MLSLEPDSTGELPQYFFASYTELFMWMLSFVEPLELQQAQTFRLYISLELLLESARCLEGVVQMRTGGVVVEDVAGSATHCTRLIENITHQTALYASKLLQVLHWVLLDEPPSLHANSCCCFFCLLFQAFEHNPSDVTEFGENRSDVLGSLDGLISLLGELSLSVRVEDKLFGSGKASILHQPVS